MPVKQIAVNRLIVMPDFKSKTAIFDFFLSVFNIKLYMPAT